MKITKTPIDGVLMVETDRLADHRGAFSRFFCADDLSALIGKRSIQQINHSSTVIPGTIRGLHFQHPPHAEMKMIRCIRGRVFDVIVDLRRNSPTFLSHYAQELSAENQVMLVAPEGCAHGFQSLVPDCEMLYLHTAPYEKSSEGGMRHDDPKLGIRWPLPVAEISDRDRQHDLISTGFAGVDA